MRDRRQRRLLRPLGKKGPQIQQTLTMSEADARVADGVDDFEHLMKELDGEAPSHRELSDRDREEVAARLRSTLTSRVVVIPDR